MEEARPSVEADAQHVPHGEVGAYRRSGAGKAPYGDLLGGAASQ